MFTPLGSLLRTLPRRSKTPEAILALFVRRAFEDALKKVCSDLKGEILETVKAGSFKNGILTVKCPQLVSTELSMRSGGLLREINEELGRRIVVRLRFRTV